MSVGDWVPLHSLNAAKGTEKGSKGAKMRLGTKPRNDEKERQKKLKKTLKIVAQKLDSQQNNSYICRNYKGLKSGAATS